MSNEEYLKFYNECLKHHMTIKKYIPVQEYLFNAITYYEKLRRNNPSMYKIDRSKDILRCFSVIMKYREYDNLNEYINFLNMLEPNYFAYTTCLKTIVLKEKGFENYNYKYTPRDYFYSRWIDFLCRLSLNTKNDVLNFEGDSRFVNIMKIVAKNGEEIPNGRSRKTYKETKMQNYCQFATNIITKLYPSDIGLQYLDSFLYYLFNEYDDMMIYLELNKLIEKENPTSPVYNLVKPLETLTTFEKPKKIIR